MSGPIPTELKPISLPQIDISARVYEDEESGIECFPTIQAHSKGYSIGSLALTSFEDLFLLRRAIDCFISTNNINDNMKEKDNEKQAVPKYAAVIEGYLFANGYAPMNRDSFNPQHMAIKSSQEIIIDLADMVDLELNDVAAAMLHFGYCTTAHDGKVGWLLRTGGTSE